MACQTNQTSPLLEKPTVSSTFIMKLRGGRPILQISKHSQLQLSLCHAGIWAFKFLVWLINKSQSLQQHLTLIIEESGSSQRGLDLQLRPKHIVFGNHLILLLKLLLVFVFMICRCCFSGTHQRVCMCIYVYVCVGLVCVCVFENKRHWFGTSPHELPALILL